MHLVHGPLSVTFVYRQLIEALDRQIPLNAGRAREAAPSRLANGLQECVKIQAEPLLPSQSPRKVLRFSVALAHAGASRITQIFRNPESSLRDLGSVAARMLRGRILPSHEPDEKSSIAGDASGL